MDDHCSNMAMAKEMTIELSCLKYDPEGEMTRWEFNKMISEYEGKPTSKRQTRSRRRFVRVNVRQER